MECLQVILKRSRFGMACFNDHGRQNDGSSSRDMHCEGCALVKSCLLDEHRRHEMCLFTNPNGVQDNSDDYPIRIVLSSYYFENGVKAIPDGKSDCSLCKTTCDGCRSHSYVKADDPNGQAYNGSGYTIVHRDQQIINVMRSWMHF